MWKKAAGKEWDELIQCNNKENQDDTEKLGQKAQWHMLMTTETTIPRHRLRSSAQLNVRTLSCSFHSSSHSHWLKETRPFHVTSWRNVGVFFAWRYRSNKDPGVPSNTSQAFRKGPHPSHPVVHCNFCGCVWRVPCLQRERIVAGRATRLSPSLPKSQRKKAQW